MTLKIIRHSSGQTTMILLVGRLQADHLDELRAQLADGGPYFVLDLDEVTSVDGDVVRFLNACDSERVTLQHCPLYIREWMALERAKRQGS
jgi:anti-anti-sigma regulatory factor